MTSKKKSLGQFFTNPVVADQMADLGYFEGVKSFLDPAVGQGAFLDALIKKAPIGQNDVQCTVFDLDGTVLEAVKQKNLANCQICRKDYLKTELSQKFDLILCNPPYHRFQDIPDRHEYIERFQEQYDIKLKGYSNLCVFFLIKSMNELNKGGRCVYIIPYEFLNTGYGVVVKEYLIRSKMLKQIYKFDNALSLFPDAVTTSCILVLENLPQESVDFLTLTALNQVKHRATYNYGDIETSVKWNRYFGEYDPVPEQGLVPFLTYAYVKRGMATGNNQYFALSQSQAALFGISEGALLKCICRAPDVNCLILTKQNFERIASEDKKAYLFQGLHASTPDDFAYLRYGESIGVHKTHLTSHRSPWYKLEKKEVAPIWISAFSRGKCKIIRNEYSVQNLTAFHSVFMRAPKAADTDLFFCYLLTPMAQELLYANRREYGEGLNKLEPSDINRSKILNLSRLTSAERSEALSIYEKLKNCTSPEPLIARLDELFRGVRERIREKSASAQTAKRPS